MKKKRKRLINAILWITISVMLTSLGAWLSFEKEMLYIGLPIAIISCLSVGASLANLAITASDS